MLKRKLRLPLLFIAGASTSAMALGQTAPSPPPTSSPPSSTPAEPEGEEIIVTAPAERGRALGGGVPDIRISREEIATYGSNSIGGLIQDLKPQTGEAPVILVNGRRISGLDEIARLPPEAISRVDILPEETSLAYGYRADQRVVNIVLERIFKAVTVEASERLPTAGGRSETAISTNALRIDDKGRMSLDFDYGRDTKLTEDERGFEEQDARFRTLMPSGEKLGLGATYNRRLEVLGGVNATLTGRIDRRTGASLFGLPLDPLSPAALEGRTRSTSRRLGLSMNGSAGSWHWGMTSGFDKSDSLSLTDRDNLSGVSRDRVHSSSRSLSGDLFANGPIANLPAGKLGATVRAALSRSSAESSTTLFGVPQHRNEANTRGSLSANINVPIASRKAKVLSALGDLTANFNIAHDGVSGIGAADTIGYGLSWSPAPAVRLTATVTKADGLPPLAQREDPPVTTPGVPVFDFVTGQSVEVSRIDGGNPGLLADSRKILALSGRYKPFTRSSLTLTAGYTQSRTRNQVGALPAITAAIEAAFPERFIRDPGGHLLTVDARPVNFAWARQKQATWGLFWSKELGKPGPSKGARPGRSALPEAGGADEEAIADASTEGSAGGRPLSRGGGGGGGRGRLLLSFNHTWQIENNLLIRDGLPVLDLLGGEAFGSRGLARHRVTMRANVMKHGLGATVEGNWQSGSQLKGSTTQLAFSDLATVNLRLFANLGTMKAISGKHPFFKNSRLSLDVTNLFNSHVEVHDSAGLTPPSFAPGRLDPLGRAVKIAFRKLF